MSDWTVDSLKEHLETVMENRFRSQESAIAKLAEETRGASDKLAAETKEYRISANEWRGQSRDQTALFPTRQEMEAKLESLADQMRAKNVQVVLSLGVGMTAVLIAVFNFASRFGS